MSKTKSKSQSGGLFFELSETFSHKSMTINNQKDMTKDELSRIKSEAFEKGYNQITYNKKGKQHTEEIKPSELYTHLATNNPKIKKQIKAQLSKKKSSKNKSNHKKSRKSKKKLNKSK